MEDRTKRIESFISLLTANQQAIFNYVLACVVRPSDADDVMQDVSATMWKKFDQYQLGTNFLAWGMQIARHKVMDHCKKTESTTKHLSKECIELLDTDRRRPNKNKDDDQRLDQLRSCINQLPPQLRSLIRIRYTDGLSSKIIAQRFGRNISSIYRMLAKTHDLLLSCLKRAFITSS